MQQPKLTFDKLTNKNVYATPSSKTVKTTPDHNCPSCNKPIYDKKPVCILCFKTGILPKKLWKKFQPKISKESKQWLKKRRGKNGKPWYEQKKKTKPRKKMNTEDKELQLLRKIGINNYLKGTINHQ